MKLIAHRGNVSGVNELRENRPDYILEAIKAGYDAEADVWVVDGQTFFGHSKPKYPVESWFLKEISEHLWLHCKNMEAIQKFIGMDYIYFAHSDDPFAITSNKYIWTNFDQPLGYKSIALVFGNNPVKVPNNVYGICGDNLKAIEDLLNV